MKKIQYPGSLAEVTLGQYQEFIARVEGVEDQKTLDEELISCFCNIDKRVVAELTGKQVTKLKLLFTTLLNQPHGLQTTFELDGTWLGFIPDLENATFGEWTDIDSYLGEITSYHKLMAVLFRPTQGARGDQYRIESYVNTEKWADKMKEMPLDVALGAVNFFSDLGLELLKTIPSYLENQMASKELQSTIEDLDRNGGGTDVTINSLMETLPKLTELHSFLSEKRSPI